MDFLIVGFLVMILAVTLASTQLLGRNTRRHLCEMQKLLVETKKSLVEVNSSMAILTHKLIGLNDERKKTEEAALEWGTKVTETFQMMAVRLNEMPSRQDLAESFKQLETLLENAPDVLDRENEAKHSRAIEEGIANLLQYQVGKGGSNHDNGSDGF